MLGFLSPVPEQPGCDVKAGLSGLALTGAESLLERGFADRIFLLQKYLGWFILCTITVLFVPSLFPALTGLIKGR